MVTKVDAVPEGKLPGHESELTPKPKWQPRYPGSGRLQGKVALITGADSGIGRAVAALYAREGADIAAVYLCEHDDAKTTVKSVEGEGRKAIAIAGDLFLACEDSSYMSAQVLHPKGGVVGNG